VRHGIVWTGVARLLSRRDGKYPHPVPVRRFAACAAILVMLLCAGAVSAAPATQATTTERIFADYVDNQVIDGNWSATDLSRALDVARANGTSFGEFAGAVDTKYNRDILGLDTSGPVGPVDDGSSLLPVPVAPGERDQPPWPFIVLSGLAAALVVTGAGSSLYRRARR
jgi:hypothetical protein